MARRKETILAHVGALAVMTVWGSTFVSSKVLLLHGLSPAEIFCFRFALAYVCMVAVSHRRLWAASLRDELTLLGLGITGGSLYFLLENMALRYSTAGNVGILVSTTPLLTALLLRDGMGRGAWLGSLLAFVGAALVVMNGQLVLHVRPLGDALALGAALTWAFYSLLMKRVMGRYGADFITRKVFAYGVLTIVPVLLMGERPQWPSGVVVWGNLLFLALVASFGAYLLWNWVMARLGAVRSTNYIYAQPMVTMAVAWATIGERITPMAVLGAAIVITGMYIMQRK